MSRKEWTLMALGIAICLAIAIPLGCMLGSHNYVVIQLTWEGNPFRCWELRETSVHETDHAIHWLEPNGNKVHVSGAHNWVRVSEGNWNAAFETLGLNQARCTEIRETQSW